MTERPWYIYALSFPNYFSPFYVGKTVSPKSRLKQHLRDKADTHKARLVRKMLAEGLSPIMLILEEGIGDWQEAEKAWIAYFPSLTNLTPGGEGVQEMADSTKQLLRKAQLETWKRNGHKEKIITPERNRKISRALKGKPKTKEHIAKLPQNQPGRKLSDERKAALTEILRKYARPIAIQMPRTEAQKVALIKVQQNNVGRVGAAKGTRLSEERKRRISETQKGRPKSEETKQKMREAALRLWAERRKKNGYFDNDTN